MKFESLKFWCKILNSEKAKARNHEIEQNGMKLLFTIIQYHEIPLGTAALYLANKILDY